MTLCLIGIGLNDEKDITVKGLETIRRCNRVYLENYTSLTNQSVPDLEKFYGVKIQVVDRDFIEQKNNIIEEAKSDKVALLVIGDPFGATTHIDLMLKCKRDNIPFEIINNASIITAVGITGLQIYKFGKTTSVPFTDKSFRPETAYEVVKQNRLLGLHTLLLLDLDPAKNKFMTANEAMAILLDIESRKNQKVFLNETKCVVCCRIGSSDFLIKFGTVEQLKDFNFGKQPHSVIVPGELHFVEEEALGFWK